MNYYVATYLLVLCCVFPTISQEQQKNVYSLEVDYLYGGILKHNPDISHLIRGNPSGFETTFNIKTFGSKNWERYFNYPDWGASFLYQNMGNPVLGENYSLLAHYTWYFFNRNLSFKTATGVTYATNPYNPVSNPLNNAYGTRFLSTSYFRLNYTKENIYKGLGFKAGIGLIHYSNGSLKSPNTSTNTVTLNAGLSYLMDAENQPKYISLQNEDVLTKQPITYQAAFRYGQNESDVIGLGQFSFYELSGYAQKRFSFKHSAQLGVDAIFSNFLKSYIAYRAIAFPEGSTTGDEDYKRVGLFAGYEINFNKTALAFQVGYYLYWPVEFETRVYNRFELKRYFYKRKIYASLSVRSHFAKAENFGIGIGVRLW